jgi:hypothetical protein
LPVGPEIPEELLRKRDNDQKALARLLGDSLQGKFKEIAEQSRLVEDAFASGEISVAEYTAAFDVLDEKFAALSPVLEETAKNVADFGDQFRSGLENIVGDSLLATIDGNFKSIGEMWANLLKRMIAQALAAKLVQSIFGAPGTANPAVAFLGQLFGGAFANGGFLEPGKIGVVGEKGPELIQAGRGGATITPNGATGQNVYNYNIAAGVTRNELVAALQLQAKSMRGEFNMKLRAAGVA